MKYSVQVLVSTINQTNETLKELVDIMNIKSDAVIGNQCDSDEIFEFKSNGHHIEVLSSRERGVSTNRNNELRIADADICIIADDDMRFDPKYINIVIDLYSKYNNADLIIFNIGEQSATRYVTQRVKKLNRLSCLKYSGARITFKREAILKKGVVFDTRFGPGSKYASGEDNLFLSQCIKKGLSAIAVPECIAILREDRASTWYNGMNEVYFRNKGAFFYTISSCLCFLMIVRFAMKNKRKYKNNMTAIQAIKLMLTGALAIRRDEGV